MGFLNEVLCILVAQGVAKLPEVKVGGRKKDPGLEPMSGEDWAKRQDFLIHLQI